MIYNKTFNTITLNIIPLNDYKIVCGSCTLYIVLFDAFSVTSTVVPLLVFSFTFLVFSFTFIGIRKAILLMPITSVNEN